MSFTEVSYSVEGQLSPEQLRAVEAVMASNSITDAAAAVGVARDTIYRWLKEPAFQSALRTVEAGYLDHISRSLLRIGEKAVGAIEGILDDQTATDTVRLKAADVALARMTAIREIVALEGRLEAIEARLAMMAEAGE